MKIIKSITLLNLFFILVFFSCTTNPEELNVAPFNVIHSSISSGDTVNVNSDLLIRFSSKIDIESFLAESIYTFTRIEIPQEIDTTIYFTIFEVRSSQSVTLNGRPLSFWYDPNNYTCAFIQYRTIYEPEGTGYGFNLSSYNEFVINSNLSNIYGTKLDNDYKLNINTKKISYIYVVPNPVYPILEWKDDKYKRGIHFINLPTTCDIIIHDVLGNEINTIHHDDEACGYEKWYLDDYDGKDIPSGIYFYDMFSIEFNYLNGIIVINR